MLEETESNVDKWNGKYSGLINKSPYGGVETYSMAANHMSECKTVEDWGCGRGWFKQYVDDFAEYVGVDGSDTPFADKKVDLRNYTSNCDGILLRHVLEHDFQWTQILQNALQSFEKVLVVVLFTSWSDSDTEVLVNTPIGVPDLSLSKREFESMVDEFSVSYTYIDSPSTVYKKETIIKIEH